MKRAEPGASVFHRIHDLMGTVNNVFLLPFLVLLFFELRDSGVHSAARPNSFTLTVSCLFFAEWVLGFVLSPRKVRYLRSPEKIIDLLSVVPLGSLFGGLRLFRLGRVFALFRMVGRTRKYRGAMRQAFHLLAVLFTTVLASALVMRSAEPETFPNLFDALWWAMSTVSTVGYGDVYPVSSEGRAVAMLVMLSGVASFGAVAAILGRIVDMDSGEQVFRESVESRLKRIEVLLSRLSDSSGSDAD